MFEDAEATAQLRQFLDGREWTYAEGPGALFDHGVGWDGYAAIGCRCRGSRC